MTGTAVQEKLADFPTRHYGSNYQSKIPHELQKYVPTGLYHFDVIPSYKKDDERVLPLRRLTVAADNEFIARRQAHEKAKMGAWERLALKSVEPNPEHIAHQAEISKHI